MISMTLLQTYQVNINGRHLGQFIIVDEWEGFIKLDAGPNKGEIIVRRKGWNAGMHWAKEDNAFIVQELEILYADSRFNLPATEVIFSNPESNDANAS